MTRNIQHHHQVQSDHDHDHHYLHTTPGKPLSLSSSKSSFRPRTASTLFVSILSTFLFSWKSFSIIHYCTPVYKLGSVSYPEILSQFQNSFLYARRDGAFYSVSHLNITGLGVPHILHSRATESRVAGFTFRRNAFRIVFELF